MGKLLLLLTLAAACREPNPAYVKGGPADGSLLPVGDARPVIDPSDGSPPPGDTASALAADAAADAAPAPVDTAPPVSPLVQARQLSTLFAAGWQHACAVSRGQLYCWGENTEGQLGDGTRTSRHVAQAVAGITDVVAVSAGDAHTCVLSARGGVSCWGRNAEGQLGDNSFQARTTPGPMAEVADGVALWTGPWSTCVRRSGGSVVCVGILSGDASDPLRRYSLRPTAIGGISGALDVALGAGSSCALLPTGSVFCWGLNGDGQLGDGTMTTRPTTAPVMNLTDARALTGGHQHYCAVRESGGVACWGRNFQGRLGDGSGLDRTTPTPVPGLANVVSLDATMTYSCAVEGAGRMFCWGDNKDGPFGIGSKGQIVVMPMRAFTSVTAPLRLAIVGAVFTCARQVASDQLLCAGLNEEGALADGTRIQRLTPVPAVLPF